MNTPLMFDNHRDINMYYDVMEAYRQLKLLNVIDKKYDLTEQLFL